MIKTHFIIPSFALAFLFANSLHAMNEKETADCQKVRCSMVLPEKFYSDELVKKRNEIRVKREELKRKKEELENKNK
jgi:hypothetical protein